MPNREGYWDYMLRRMREEDMNDNFIKRFASDSQDGQTEIVLGKEQMDELQNRYFYSHERRTGMTFDEYMAQREFGVDVERALAEQDEDMSLGAQQANEMASAWKPGVKEMTDSEYFDHLMATYDEDKLDCIRAQMDMSEREAFALHVHQVKKMDEEYLMETFHPIDPEAEQARDEIQMAVDPGHYKGVAGGKQYIELMAEILEGYSGVESHLLGQSYKYMMRLGKKDAPEQDAKKAAFYLMCLVQYHRDGEIVADKVQAALKEL